MSIKLTPARLAVLLKMAEGWELGRSTSLAMNVNREWLQKDGIGRGGETEKVRAGTARALESAQLIKRVRASFPSQAYVITDYGRQWAERAQGVGNEQ